MNMKEKIQKIKKERNAVILVHNYQLPEVQDIGDYVGDSLGLSIEAGKTDAEVIVFCGVYFMAETAKIISPDKTVLIPDKNAGCPMADMITGKQLRELKQKHPRAKVMCYVNSTAEVKAECDLCCTSSNAIRLVENVLKDEKEIIFVPDKYLATYTTYRTGKKFILWPGYCPSHVKILPAHIQEQKNKYPDALVMVHPECPPSITELADQVLSTSGMSRFARESESKQFIVGTETGMLYRLKKDNPEKFFYAASEFSVCPNMKLTTQAKVLRALENMSDEVTLDENIMLRAKRSIMNMINECLD